MRKLQDTQAEMEDALIELKVSTCLHAGKLRHPNVELSPLYANDDPCC